MSTQETLRVGGGGYDCQKGHRWHGMYDTGTGELRLGGVTRGSGQCRSSCEACPMILCNNSEEATRRHYREMEDLGKEVRKLEDSPCPSF